MRHHKAAQKGEGGPWHYVSLGRDGGYPIGYCTDACTHETADEAREHYRQWMLDGHTFDSRSGNDTQYRCEIPVNRHVAMDEGCEECVRLAGENRGAGPCHRCHGYHGVGAIGECPVRPTSSEDADGACGRWTQRLALGPDGYDMHHVCGRHANRESIELLYPVGSVGEAWES